MKVERVRVILGVWAPMAIGLFIIATSVNFYVTAQLSDVPLAGNLESWRLVCSAGAFFVGAVLLLSTYGRYRKAREARRVTAPPAPSALSPPAPTHHDDSDDERDRDHHDD
jgi:hypothetical protein